MFKLACKHARFTIHFQYRVLRLKLEQMKRKFPFAICACRGVSRNMKMFDKYCTIYARSTQHLDKYWTSFGDQSGLDESSRRTSTTFLHAFAFRVCLVFWQKRKNTKCLHILTKLFFQRHVCFARNKNEKVFAASLKHRKWGLKVPIHTKRMSLILISMPF